MLPANTEILADAESVATRACRLIENAAQAALRERGVFRLVLAGGSTPQRAYELLAQTDQDWLYWEIFWGDERCLPTDHPERNSHPAHTVWLSKIPIPKQNIHPIPAERGAEQAAEAYARIIRGQLPFDTVLLGMGEDGHTASLFPKTIPPPPPFSKEETRGGGFLAPPLKKGEWSGVLSVAVHNAPKPPPERVSLTVTALQSCRQQLVLVTGTGKAEAIRKWRNGADLPIALATKEDACLLLDSAAAG